MKTSNKLLLGIFLTIIILITTVQLMVYAKYKRGEYTAFKREQFVPMTSLPVPAARFVSLKGMGSCAIKPSTTLRLEIQKDNSSFIKYHVVNDTLVITGNSNDPDGSRNNSLVNIYLPASVQLKGADCTFRIWGADDSTSAPSYNISIKNSYLFINFSGADNAAVYFNQLNLNSVSSAIDLNNHAVLNDLNLQFADSRLNDQRATIRKLTMGSDNTSTIDLSGKNVNALK
ncbi:MAG: hypothetical protein ACJ751_14575 [Niastella sp.]|uniref:hypothetical protein n=1 Tax=Niastella sp. TaxID=1869183 RepID=UPI003899E33F